MSYPEIKKSMYCSNCKKRINGSFITVRDNFMIRKFFQFEDGSDNVFCGSECLANFLSSEEIFLDEEDDKYE